MRKLLSRPESLTTQLPVSSAAPSDHKNPSQVGFCLSASDLHMLRA